MSNVYNSLRFLRFLLFQTRASLQQKETKATKNDRRARHSGLRRQAISEIVSTTADGSCPRRRARSGILSASPRRDQQNGRVQIAKVICAQAHSTADRHVAPGDP